LLGDPAQAARLADVARDRARSYQWEQLARRVALVYQLVLRDGGERERR
jgi:hypothetical protein